MSLQKSTIVRLINSTRLIITRAAFGTLERLAPGLGARWAADLWLTVPRYRGRARRDLPPGTAFTATVRSRQVRGTVWGTGPTVYLVHGWGGAGVQLLSFVNPLVASGHKVVAFDSLSHGTSDPGELGPRRATIPEMTRALTAVVKEHGQPHAVVAHSAGALATFYALRGGLRPDRLIFLAPMVQPTELTKLFAATLGFGERIRTGMTKGVERRANALWSDFDVPTQVTRIAPPPLLTVHDPTDREIAYANSLALVETWPDTELVTVEGVGHWRILRDSGVVTRAVDYVTRHSTELQAM
ncbi:alpha/beta fold hydrolase [Actinophytocola oryzae]|uniref:Alpha/beta hydrolase family protein n=1 Tax=Actinophytocola oryzae TaxID=502181 RepID=A0A4R7VX54_9PSEU|nr:alpha/beta fold hydrolase [Actinophytocola oryzae]TDV53797.1 alpha/beta hydrolase family protein [Actinophytocola oryzae]